MGESEDALDVLDGLRAEVAVIRVHGPVTLDRVRTRSLDVASDKAEGALHAPGSALAWVGASLAQTPEA